MIKLSRFSGFFAVLVLLISTISVRASDTDQANAMESLSDQVQKIFSQNSAAVVKIRAVDLDQTLAGSGFFIDNKGSLLTAYDVVLEATKVMIEYNGHLIDAKVIGRDARSGVALLKTDLENTPFIPMGDSDNLKIANGLVGIGYAYNLPVSPSFGIISGFDVHYLSSFFATTHIRCTVSVNPGQIGGPLLNSKGEVVAMIVFSVDSGRECYGLPINSVNRIVADLKEFGVAKHGWVGVGVIESQPDKPYAHAVYVSHLYENTPAMTCGLQLGDQVISIGNRKIFTPQDIIDASFFAKVGSTIPVRVIRGDKELSFDLKIIERPALKVPVSITIPYALPSSPIQVNVKK